MNQFYTYIWRDPKNRVPIYVGKGHGKRVWDHMEDKSNAQYARLLKKRHQADYVCLPQIIWCESENLALELEVFLIAEIGRKDLGKGPLLNRTDGGDGTTGWTPDEHVRQKMRAAAKKRNSDPTYHDKRIEGFKRTTSDPSWKERFRKTITAASNRPDVVSERKRIAKDSWARDDVRAKRIASLRVTLSSPESKAKRSQRSREFNARPEVLQKRSNSLKVYASCVRCRLTSNVSGLGVHFTRGECWK